MSNSTVNVFFFTWAVPQRSAISNDASTFTLAVSGEIDLNNRNQDKTQTYWRASGEDKSNIKMSISLTNDQRMHEWAENISNNNSEALTNLWHLNDFSSSCVEYLTGSQTFDPGRLFAICGYSHKGVLLKYYYEDYQNAANNTSMADGTKNMTGTLNDNYASYSYITSDCLHKGMCYTYANQNTTKNTSGQKSILIGYYGGNFSDISKDRAKNCLIPYNFSIASDNNFNYLDK